MRSSKAGYLCHPHPDRVPEKYHSLPTTYIATDVYGTEPCSMAGQDGRMGHAPWTSQTASLIDGLGAALKTNQSIFKPQPHRRCQIAPTEPVDRCKFLVISTKR
jgi:hypothetical protein